MDYNIAKIDGPHLPSFMKLSLVLNTPVLIVVLLVFFIGYVIISIILFYHWRQYGMRSTGIIIGRILFTFVSLVLFFCALLALSLY